MRHINKIIIHCAATRPSMNVGAKEIRAWHVKDNGWDDIGYHYVIKRDGTVENGRSLLRPGAHTKGHNANSIGVCLVGGLAENGKDAESNFTDSQWSALATLVKDLKRQFPNARVAGHNEFSKKACPSFDVQKWWRGVA